MKLHIIVITKILLILFSNYTLISQEKFSKSSDSTLTLSEVINFAIEATNSFEDYREFPDTLISLERKIPLQTLLKVFADAIIAIDDNSEIIFTLNQSILRASDLYINIELDSLVYGIPFTKDEYLSLCRQIQQELSVEIQLPNLFYLRNSQIRCVEVIYLFAAVIRYYDFYNQLPEFQEIMVTPKGLVPWALSEEYRIYTSMNSGNKILATNNMYNVGKYEAFKIAKKVISNETNSYLAGKLIYEHVIDQWLGSGYYLWIKPLGEPDYAYSQYRFNRSNSASQQDKINMLLRSIGLPSTGFRMFDEISDQWINTDVHKPYGAEPYGNPWPDDTLKPLAKNTELINKIKEISSYNNTLIEDKYIWINSSDIAVYGADYILEKCKSGGINNIILTVKSSFGYLFYPTQYNMLSGREKFRFDAISDIANKSVAYNIKIFPAISVLNDNLWALDGPNNVENTWHQYFLGNTNINNYINTTAISPCIESYKNIISLYLKEIANLPNIAGIVLSSLYMETLKYRQNTIDDLLNVPDGNPHCSCCWDEDFWQSKLLKNYAIDLISVIKNENSDLKVILSSYPLFFSYYEDFEGMQDKELMKNLADAYLIPVGYSQWLNPVENFLSPPKYPAPFLPADYINQLAINSEKPIIVSFSLKDEWIYTPAFYRGLASNIIDAGASSICFHEFNSLEGSPEGFQLLTQDEPNIQYFPAFDYFQYSTIGNFNFMDAPVPVELSSFTANLHQFIIILNWSTATEYNNLGFEIERSINSKSWDKLGFVTGIGTTVETSYYSFKDTSATNSKVYYYRLKQLDLDGHIQYSRILTIDRNLPIQFELSQNYPNPFNPKTSIEYSIPYNELVSIKVYDILGKEVATLVNEQKPPGNYKVEFDACNLASSIYFYKLRAGSFAQIRKMLLVK